MTDSPSQSVPDRLTAALADRYRLERKLGEGGMASVYLAEDLKHRRRVAIKVLKPELAARVGTERFLGEIRTTANLLHPHILPLFDSGEADGFLYYVMPYVEGESLRERLQRERQLPCDEAVSIALKIGAALQAAHEAGVVHRDIKPANILLEKGEPVVSDFGIALALSESASGRLTDTGTSLGTPSYMSPEQATGDRVLDPRTDIYSLGCVLYEMLVGEPPFVGSTPQAILGRIVVAEPPHATDFRSAVPTHVDAVIRRALEKVPADRFESASQMLEALRDEAFRHGRDSSAGRSSGARQKGWYSALPWGVAAVLLALLLWPSSTEPPQVQRFTIPLSRDSVLLGGEEQSAFSEIVNRTDRPARTALALSPNGDVLAFVGRVRGEEAYLYVRPFSRHEATRISGTEGARIPFFSPDGAWIGLAQDDALMRVRASDGEVEVLTPQGDTPGIILGIDWADDGFIYAWIRSQTDRGLYRVPDTGGEWSAVAAGSFEAPLVLPGGESLLFHRGQEIFALDLETGEERFVVEGSHARLSPDGHLLFMRPPKSLMAVPFDLSSLSIVGDPVVMVENVMLGDDFGNTQFWRRVGQYDISRNGHLAFALNTPEPVRTRRIVRIDPDGTEHSVGLDEGSFSSVRVSPDGSRIAYRSGGGSGGRVWIHDLRTGVSASPVPDSISTSGAPVWSPDGQFLAVNSVHPEHGIKMLRVRADGSGTPEVLVEDGFNPRTWAESGAIAHLVSGEGGYDIWVRSPEGESSPFVATEYREEYPSLSPDGRWLVFTNDRTGRQEVYVRPYPDGEPEVRVSPSGGTSPIWSKDGRKIYFFSTGEGPFEFSVVDVTPDNPFRVGAPSAVEGIRPCFSNPVTCFDPLPDGSFMTTSGNPIPGGEPDRSAYSLEIVLNWTEELNARLGEVR